MWRGHYGRYYRCSTVFHVNFAYVMDLLFIGSQKIISAAAMDMKIDKSRRNIIALSVNYYFIFFRTSLIPGKYACDNSIAYTDASLGNDTFQANDFSVFNKHFFHIHTSVL